jgi:hypothetical protein
MKSSIQLTRTPTKTQALKRIDCGVVSMRAKSEVKEGNGRVRGIGIGIVEVAVWCWQDGPMKDWYVRFEDVGSSMRGCGRRRWFSGAGVPDCSRWGLRHECLLERVLM